MIPWSVSEAMYLGNRICAIVYRIPLTSWGGHFLNLVSCSRRKTSTVQRVENKSVTSQNINNEHTYLAFTSPKYVLYMD